MTESMIRAQVRQAQDALMASALADYSKKVKPPSDQTFMDLMQLAQFKQFKTAEEVYAVIEVQEAINAATPAPVTYKRKKKKV